MEKQAVKRIATFILSALIIFSMALPGTALSLIFGDSGNVYADSTVSSWIDLRNAINSGGTQTISLGADFAYDGQSIDIPSDADITITGDHTIYSDVFESYDSMFKVKSGGSLTVDSGVTMSGKMGASNQTCPDGKDGRPTYNKDNFTGSLNNPDDPSDYEPRGFFIHVESGGQATLKGTVSDFITSRDKSETPRYVAPIVASGVNAVFNLDGGTIKNNLVGYIVNDAEANKDAQSIKQYVKGAGPNVPRVPQASVQKQNKDSFDRPRAKDAGIDGGLPGTGITATAGAIIYKGGAQGTIKNGIITNNRADTGGVMVSGEGTTVKMESGVISKNVGVQFGGGSTAEQGGTIEMTGGNMEYNVAWFGGGAVYATENGVAWLLGLMNGEDGLHPQFDDRLDGRFLMNGGSLNNNTALTRGGAILADSDAVDVKKGALKYNMSRMLGGAVYVMGDHPKYTYTMYLTGLYVHDNVAVSGLDQARASAAKGPSSMYTKQQLDNFNSSLQRTLLAPSACGDVPDDILGDVFNTPNSDDMNDGWGTHGTGGGVWLCAYGTTYFNAGATSQVVIAKNYATGAVPLNQYDYPRWIKNSSDGQSIREDLAYNTAASVATGTGRTGGNDLHADTGSSGSVIIKNDSFYPGWIDENASTSSQIPYNLSVSEGRVNIVNNGKAQTMPDANVQVEVSGNISRRGGGLAANGTFMLGMRDDQANVESAVDLKKAWHATAEKKPVSIRVSAVQGSNTAVIADVPLDGEANAPISEYDSVEELAPTGSTWNGRFKLPIELNGTEGKIKVFNLVLKEDYREDGDTNGIIDPTMLQGRTKLAAAIKRIKEKHKDPGSGEIDEEAVIAEINSAISIQFSNNLKLSCKEYEMVYDDASGTWTVKTEGGQPVESSSYVFTSRDVDLSAASFELQSTSFYGEEYNKETQKMEPVEIYQVHVFGIELALSAQNDNNPVTEKYVNKDVHSDIINFDQDFEYDIMAYVPLTAEEFTISDTLVEGLEFAGPGGNANTNPSQVVRSIAVKTLNNHEPGEEGTVSGPGEPGRNGNPMNLKPGQNPVLPGGKTINVNTQLGISGKTLTVHVPAGDTLDLLKGKWVQVTFGARIEDRYRSLDALKDLSAGVDGKDKSWEGTDTDKKGVPAYEYLVANGDKAIVAPILAEVGDDPVIWAVEAPSRLFARTAKGDYYATPMNDKSGNTWTRLDKDLDDGKDDGYGKPVWINADNRYYGRAPHVSNTRRQLGLDDPELSSLKEMPLIVGSKVTKAAEGATRYFAEVTDAEGGVHIWATDKGEMDSLKWHEVTEKSSDEYVQAQGRLSNDRYTIRMLDLDSETIALDPDSETGKNWPVISAEEHEGMANQASYSVKFGNNAEAKTYKTNTVTVAPETTELELKKVWDVNGRDEWPDGVEEVTFGLWSLKDGAESELNGNIDADGVFVPDSTAPQAVFKLTDEKRSASITALPKLKGTSYIAREIKIGDKAVEYNGDKTSGNLISDDLTVFTSMEAKLKDGRFEKAEKQSGERLLAGAEADGRLWVMTQSGKYYVTAENDTDGTGDAAWTMLTVPSGNNPPADVVAVYDRAKAILGAVEASGRQTPGEDGEADTVDLTKNKLYTATNLEPNIEKYVNDDVHAELGEFDKAFKYDIMVYVPEGSTALTISDSLNSKLEFAVKKESLEEAEKASAIRAESAEETIASVVYKSKNDHKANSTVSGKDADNPATAIAAEDYTASIDSNKLLRISFIGKDDPENEGLKLPLDFAGNWVQVTFWAKYTDKAIAEADAGAGAGVYETVRDNGSVISDVYPSVSEESDEISHEGTVNYAAATIEVDNEFDFAPETNGVTVKPDTTKVYVRKKWSDTEDAPLAEWPEGLTVNINVYKEAGGERGEVVDTIPVSDLELKESKALPKLIGVTYIADEVEIPEGYVKSSVEGQGIQDDPFIITNTEKSYVDLEVTKNWKNATMDELPSADDFKTYLRLKNGAGEDVSEQYLENLTVIAKGTTYTAKWTRIPEDTYTVEEKDVPGFETVQDGNVITNTKKPEEEKPEIEKFVNQAVHKDIELEEEFTYDIVAYVTKDADSVIITDTLDDVLAFAGDAASVSVTDLGMSNNDKVTNSIENVIVNDDATVATDGIPIKDAAVEIDGKTLKVSISNKLKPVYAENTSDESVPAEDESTESVPAEGENTENVPADGESTENTPTENDPEPEIVGYEYDGEEQPVTLLRGHWVRVTFKARIDGKTIEEVKGAYKEITSDQIDAGRAEENTGNAPVISVEDHFGIPNDASYSIGVANEAGIQGDVHTDASNTVTVKPKEKPEYVTVNVTKTWDNAGDKNPPASVTIRLFANEEEIGSMELSEANKWAGAFENLPKYEDQEKKEGQIRYTVTEDPIKDYEATIEGSADAGYNVKNVYSPLEETVSLKVIKTWDDQGNEDGRRPTTVTFRLVANGQITGETLVLSSENAETANMWSGSFGDLPASDDDGNLIEYTVTEDAVPYYKTVIDKTATAVRVTNIHRPWFEEVEGDSSDEGSFTVRKTVSGNVPADRAYDIKVTLTFENGRTYTRTLSLTPGGEPFLFDYIKFGTVVKVEEVTTGFKVTYRVNGKEKQEFTLAAGEDYEIVVLNEEEEPVKEQTKTTGTVSTAKSKKETKQVAAATGDDARATVWLALALSGAFVSIILMRKKGIAKREKR